MADPVDRDAPRTRPPGEQVDLIGGPLTRPLADRWALARCRWTELTFYLFDPQGWRP